MRILTRTVAIDVYKRQHLTLNPTEEFISQTSTAFYDVLVEVEKA